MRRKAGGMQVLEFVERLFLTWALYSCIGWIWETGLSIVVRRRFVALRRRDGLFVRLSGLRRLRCRMRVRRHTHQSRNGTRRGRPRQVYRLRSVCQGLSEGSDRVAQEVGEEPRHLRIMRQQGQGRSGDESLQGGLHRLRQMLQGMRIRCDYNREQSRFHRLDQMPSVPQVRRRMPDGRDKDNWSCPAREKGGGCRCAEACSGGETCRESRACNENRKQRIIKIDTI